MLDGNNPRERTGSTLLAFKDLPKILSQQEIALECTDRRFDLLDNLLNTDSLML